MQHKSENESCQEAEARRDRRDLKILRRAVRWALGELGEFPLRPEGAGLYWWRGDLRRAAGRAARSPYPYEAKPRETSAATPPPDSAQLLELCRLVAAGNTEFTQLETMAREILQTPPKS